MKRLQDLLGFSFEFPKGLTGRSRPHDLPEIQLISLIVISTKLLFPFDDLKRYPTSAKEPTTQVIDWKLWAQTQRHFDSRETARGRIGKGNEILVNERDVFNMTPSQLDEYMSWYENNWLDNSKGMAASKTIVLFVPLTLEKSVKSIKRAISRWANQHGLSRSSRPSGRR